MRFRCDVWLASLLVGLWYTGWLLISHPLPTPAAVAFSDWADYLIAHGSLPEFRPPLPPLPPLIFYSLYIALVAGAKILAGGAWRTLMLSVNVLAVVAAALAVLSFLAALRAPRYTLVIVAGWLALSPELLLWTPQTMTDVLYMALASFIIVGSLRPLVGLGGSLAGAGVALAPAAILRPVVVPLALSWLGTWLLRRSIRLWILFVVGLVVFALGLGMAVVVGHLSVGAFGPWLEHVRQLASTGVVVDERSSTFTAPATSLATLLGVVGWRLLHFFSPWLAGYSVRHLLITTMWFLPVYVLSLRAIWQAPQRRAVLWLVGYISLVALFHSLQELDLDHRYRLTIIPALLVLAGLELVPARVESKKGRGFSPSALPLSP